MTSSSAAFQMGQAQADVEYTPADFQRITVMLADIAGIRMPPSNEALVFSRLAKRVRAMGLARFGDYISLVAQAEHRDERDAMVEALTTNTTRFFRESYHFDTFAEEVMPQLTEDARNGRRVRIWSAACSSGEEPYSAAAVLLATFPDAATHDVKILATDINRNVLSIAETGVYPEAVMDSVPSAYASGLFDPVPVEPGRVRIRSELRSLVTFRYMNFMEPWPVRGPFDAIFCRNAVIYMEEETQERIWSGLSSVLRPGGYLFIGHSERIGPEFKDRLELCGKTTFRRI